MKKSPPPLPSKPYIPYMDRLSAAQRAAFKKKMLVMRERFGERMAKSGRTVCTESGKYDAIFEEGVKWLDSLAGEPFPEGEVTVHFVDDVWESSARSGTDI